jgi:hypothetical protein
VTRFLGKKLGFNPLTWMRQTRRMRTLVAAFDAREPAFPASKGFLVVLVPWLGTTVPWFSLASGLFLASSGSRVTFVLDDLRFGGNGVRFRFVLACMESVLRVLRGRFPTWYLSHFAGEAAVNSSDRPWIERLARLNAIWALRGEVRQAGRKEYTERSIFQLSRSVVAVRKLLDAADCEAILVPGGIYGSSGVWAECARAAGIRVCSFDSGGADVVMLAASGIACQLQDIPRAFAMLKRSCTSAEDCAAVEAAARAEMNRRRAGTDRFASQVRASRSLDSRVDGALVLALNSSWDSAALGLHAIFEGSAEWIVDTVRFLLENTNVPVIVRQHPAERLEIARSTDDYRELLERHFPGQARLLFIAADDPVNSYELMERAAALIVYTSTIGIEAAAIGKVVVTPSVSYYSDLGFVWKAYTLEEYHRHLQNAATRAYRVTSTMQADALFCYYLTQCCNWLTSPFSPEGFDKWSRQSLSNLCNQEGVRLTVRSLVQNIPVAYLNHVAGPR